MTCIFTSFALLFCFWSEDGIHFTAPQIKWKGFSLWLTLPRGSYFIDLSFSLKIIFRKRRITVVYVTDAQDISLKLVFISIRFPLLFFFYLPSFFPMMQKNIFLWLLNTLKAKMLFFLTFCIIKLRIKFPLCMTYNHYNCLIPWVWISCVIISECFQEMLLNDKVMLVICCVTELGSEYLH